MVIQSAKVVHSSRVELVLTTPKSKYDMSSSMIDSYKSALEMFIPYFKQQLDIPRSVTMVGILKDSKGRELSKVSK